jgi:hypothetical protein
LSRNCQEIDPIETLTVAARSIITNLILGNGDIAVDLQLNLKNILNITSGVGSLSLALEFNDPDGVPPIRFFLWRYGGYNPRDGLELLEVRQLRDVLWEIEEVEDFLVRGSLNLVDTLRLETVIRFANEIFLNGRIW